MRFGRQRGCGSSRRLGRTLDCYTHGASVGFFGANGKSLSCRVHELTVRIPCPSAARYRAHCSESRRLHICHRPAPAPSPLPARTTLPFAHTLSGTAVAVPRLIVAFLENGASFNDSHASEVDIPRASVVVVAPFVYPANKVTSESGDRLT
ncbi:hypothetical protein BJV78DRAFT_1169761 [Lactifluus subvellereus]|nr:hypothetical protein BJV78DRAFT_1169761 [Lactifluus subvellereus]